MGDFSGFEEILGLGGVFGRDGDDDARLAFVEEGDVGAGAGNCGFSSEVPTHAGFREVDGQAAFRAVVGAAYDSIADHVADGVLDGEFFGVVELRRGAGFASVDGEEVV